MPTLRSPFLAATLAALTGPSLVPAPAQAYPIDCAILLCLAGGWPDSAPCAAGWAEFIRRLTPFPIEPPLQIWRCPMGVSMPTPPPSLRERLFAIAAPADQTGIEGLIDVQSTGGADVDISGPAFDFVRSIRVFHIDYRQAEGRENCIRSDATRLGTYSTQGEYGWQRSRVTQVPAASQLRVPDSCDPYAYRAVFVDWHDHAGRYGFEEVRY